MELREFAERILFGTTLEQKLDSPGFITDERPGSPLVAPRTPGRPGELQFKPEGSARGDFPRLQRLDHPRERGRLLHFFANHELLATELMALVLLRFPDAPAAFRRGVLQTLRDEQEHTRLYIQRMKECGIHFGEFPLSGYFWRAIAGMQNPMDYVAGLSLTFEQANLDFARQFAREFAMVGDAATAQLLERIYHDEIGHVATGLKWFRRWKNPQESDWAAFCRQLKFPLSPSRAKGLTLNVEGRRAAGFDSTFIAELNVYSQSKGRTPNVFYFNPFTEAYIDRGKSFSPVKQQALLAKDLAKLPQFLCRQDDIVLVDQLPSLQFLSELKQAGFSLPEFIALDHGRIPATSNLLQRKIGSLKPWAWGPDSVQLLESLFPNVSGESRRAEQRYNSAIADLYSKEWSAAFLHNMLQSRSPESWLCSELEGGVTVSEPETAFEVIEGIRRRGHHKIVVKEALGLAGHNALRLWEPEVSDSQRRWMLKAFENGRRLVIEPWLERLIDFSVQLEMGPRGLKLCGYTGLTNDLKGQFQANWAAPNYQRRLPTKVVALFRQSGDVPGRLHSLFEAVFELLADELARLKFEGPLGIDAFVYRGADGECRLKPIVEINPRYTMGRVLVELMKQTAPGSFGEFRLLNQAVVKRESGQDFGTYAASLKGRFPLVLQGDPVAKIREGVLCLNDPAEAQAYLALFCVTRPRIINR
jgi:uncharacterized ferritin-like protein (DUF455 family)